MNTMPRLARVGGTLLVTALALFSLAPSSPAQDRPPADAKQAEPHIIISEHVLLWENQIVTWDEVVARLRSLRKSGPFHATFCSTNGVSAKRDRWQDYHDRIMALYREIFEPVGVSFSSLSPRGSARWDAIRTPDDLRPDPKHRRSGQVVTPQGERAQNAQVIVIPAAGSLAMLDVALSGTQMRDPFDEQWSPTDENGHFVVYPADDSYLLAILHPSGFAIQASVAKNVLFRLQPWATITFNSTGDVADQQAYVSIKPTGTKPGEPGFTILSVETKGKPVEVKVPAGKIVVSRSLAMEQGRSVTVPVEEFSLTPGETRTIELKPPSEADRKRSQELYERLHGRRRSEH